MTTSEYTPPPPTAPPPANERPAASPAPEPASRRVRRGPRSLLSKITIGVVSLVIVLVSVIGTLTYFQLRSFQYSRLDEQVRTAVNMSSSALRPCLLNDNPYVGCIIGGDEDKYRAPQTEWLAVLSTDGRELAKPTIDENETLKRLRITDAQLARLADSPNQPETLTTLDGKELRVVARPIRTTLGNAYVVSGLPTTEVHSTLNRLVLLLLTIGSASVVIAMLATGAGVRFSLRRLRRVTVTAEDVAKELSPEGAGLDRRVPDDEPDTEVGQLATSFNTMLAAVETQFAARVESEQRMRQFLADASHELRTPLTSIRGYAELARMQRAMGDAGEDNLDRIEFEGTRMSRLVEDLLLLARGDGHGDDRPMQSQLIDIAGLVDDAVSGARAAFPLREIIVDEVDPDAHVVGDPDQLLRVVRNLVTNAAVHTAPERPIRVSGTAYEYGVTIQVVDGGPGLSPEDAAHVFERFWRADKARTRARGGSGLGMSIVASIVRRHGGTVRFDSTVEHGSTVTVWLPGVQPG